MWVVETRCEFDLRKGGEEGVSTPPIAHAVLDIESQWQSIQRFNSLWVG